MRARRVLLIEDEPDILGPLHFLFEDEGFVVDALADGSAALAHVRGDVPVPDVVVLDLHLPKVSGYEVLREMRANARYAQVPVLVLTASTPEVSRIVRTGGAELLGKPCTTERLMRMVRRMLGA